MSGPDIARGWDEAVDGYTEYFVPRFAPWATAAVDALADLPDGPVVVPCCGPFPELDALAARFPGREFVGIDLSAGMVRGARERAAGNPLVSVVEGDATDLGPWAGRAAAVVSVFGLQQLPEPDLALRSWAAALRPSGRLSVVYWPSETEQDGPFARVAAVLRADGSASDRSWEDRLVPALAAAGLVVERDEHPAFAVAHASAAAFIDAFTWWGPLRARAIARGDAFAARVRADFLRGAPEGPWHHRPRARLVVARR